MVDNTQSVEHFPQIIISLLKFHYLWPQTNLNVDACTIVKILSLYQFCFYFFFCFWVYFIIIFIVGTKIDFADSIIGIVEGTFCGYMFVIYVPNMKKIINFVKHLTNVDKFGKPPKLAKFKRKHNKFMKFFYIYCVIGAMIYFAISYWDGPDCERRNILENKENICGLIIPMWTPYKLNDPTSKKVTFIFEMVVCSMMVLPAAIGTYFLLTMIDFITLKISHLKTIIRSVPRLSYEEKKETLILSIHYHRSIIGLTNELNDCFGKISAVHYVLTALLFGILNYQILTTVNIAENRNNCQFCLTLTLRRTEAVKQMDLQLKGIIHLFGWLFAMFLLCGAGQSLIDESTSISDTIYSLDWYEYNSELNFYLKMMMMRSQKSLSAEAGIFSAYSYRLLLNILQASYTYMTILKQINTKKLSS